MNIYSAFLILSIFSTTNSTTLEVLAKFFSQCSNKTDISKCFKVQSLKLMDRASQSNSIGLIDGVALISDRQSRSVPLNATEIDGLSSEEIDTRLVQTTENFIKNHKFEIELSEARRRKGGRGGWGALLWALAIKGTFLAVAYQGIALMSGIAVLVGKLALILSAILGLKKLVSGEKTTFEIVKVPKHTEKHSHSTSYEDDEHYRRTFDEFGKKVVHSF